MRSWLAGALAALTLTGCATEPAAPPPAPPPPVYVPPPAPVPMPVRDQCGAGALQTLIGRSRTEIPVPVNPASRRVTCTTCPVTMDFNPARLNILYDADSGIVREVKCG